MDWSSNIGNAYFHIYLTGIKDRLNTAVARLDIVKTGKASGKGQDFQLAPPLHFTIIPVPKK